MSNDAQNKSHFQDKWPINHFLNHYPTELAPYQFIYNDMQNRANEHQRLNNSYAHWEHGGGLPPLVDLYNSTSFPSSTANATNPRDIGQPRNYSMSMTHENSAPCNSVCVCTGEVLFHTHYSIH